MQTSRISRRRSEILGPLVSSAPAMAGIMAGGFLIFFSDARIVQAIGAAIVLLTFLVSDIAEIKRALVAIIVLEIPIQADTYIGHNALENASGALSGFNISVTTFVLLVLYTLWLLELIAGRSRVSRHVLMRAAPVLVYTVLVVLSLRVAFDPSLALFEITLLIQALAILLYVAHHLTTPRDLLYVLSMLFVGILLQVMVSLVLYVQGSTIELGIVSTRVIGERVAGTLGHPNSLGAWLSLIVPVAGALMFAPIHRRYRLLAGAAFVSGTVLLGLSQSRGGFTGFVVAMAVLVLIMYRRRLVSRRLLARAGALALIPLAIQLSFVGSRLLAFEDSAAQARLPLIDLAMKMISDHALFGVGANNFALALDNYVTIDFSAAWISTVHNRYLLIWTETGILALIAFLLFLGTTVAGGLRVARRPDRSLALIAAGLTAGVVANAVHMTVDIYHNRPLIQSLWLVAGLLIAVERISSSSTRRPEAALVSLVSPAHSSRRNDRYL